MENLLASTVLEHWFAARSSAPLITFYGDEGARIELSGASALNAVAKAVNLLQHDLLLDPADVVWFDLPACHWQTPLLAVAVWAAGLTVALGPSAPEGTAATLGFGTGEPTGIALAVSTHPWGMPLGAQTPPGWEDLSAMTRVQPDRTTFRWAPAQGTWLLDAANGPSTGAALLQSAGTLRTRWGLADSGRLVSWLTPAARTGLLACTLVPALAGGSVILTTHDGDVGILRQEGNAVEARFV